MAEKKKLNEEVKEYWEKPDTVSIIDKNLHKIEIDIACGYLLPTDAVADIGCGDGVATALYARRAKSCVGFERSNHLRSLAVKHASKSGLKNIFIKPGDIMKMGNVKEKFDAIITQRLIINLMSWKEQRQAILAIRNMLKPGGRYIMIENMTDSFQAMNKMREEVGLPPVPQHWHNRFMDYDTLATFMEDKFQLLKVHDLGLYYLLTRVYVPMFASFKGYGAKAVKDPIYEHSDAAARVIFEKYNDSIHVGKDRAFGPIQVIVYRRDG